MAKRQQIPRSVPIDRSTDNGRSITDWLASRKPHTKCPACLHAPTREAIREVLDHMARDSKHSSVSMQEIHVFLSESVPSYPCSSAGLRRHLNEHERERWHRAKGR